MRYDAFISYNHGADGGIAPYLQEALQRISMPWYRRRGMAVFRDYTDLPADADLGEAIEAALDQSRYYVLLASPGSRDSRWVGQEIDHWLATKTAARKRMVLILTDGTIVADSQQGIDFEQSTALHEQMRGRFEKAPLYIDLTSARTKIDDHALSRRQFRREYRHEVALVAAKVKEVEVRDVIDDDVKFQHRRLLLAYGAATMLLALAVLAVLGLLSAQRNAREARAETAKAQSGEFAAQSTAALATDTPFALALALAADGHSPSPLATDALRVAATKPIEQVLGPTGATRSAGLSESIRPLAMTDDGRFVATAGPAGSIVVWDRHDGSRRRIAAPSPALAVTTLAYAPDGRLAAGYTVPQHLADGQEPNLDDPPGEVVLWNRELTHHDKPWPSGGTVSSLAFSTDGGRLATGAFDGSVILHDLRAGTDAALSAPDGVAVFDVAFAHGGGTVAATTGGLTSGAGQMTNGQVRRWDTSSFAEQPPVDVGADSVFSIAWTRDDGAFLTGDSAGKITYWDAVSDTESWNLQGDVPVRHVVLDSTGSMLFSSNDQGQVAMWSADGRNQRVVWTDGSVAPALAISGDGTILATGDPTGRVTIDSVDRLAPSFDSGDGNSFVAFGQDGHTVLTVPNPSTTDGLFAWDVRTARSHTVLGQAAQAVLSGDGRRIAVSASDAGPHTVTEIDVTSTDPACSTSCTARLDIDGTVQAMALDKDGKRLVAFRWSPDSSDPQSFHGDFTVWDVATGQQVTSWSVPAREASPVLVAVTRDLSKYAMSGRELVLGPAGSSRATAVPRLRVTPLRGAFSPDGRQLAGFGYGTTGTLVNTLTGRTRALGALDVVPTAVAWSPRGDAIAIGDAAHDIQLWDPASGNVLTTWHVDGAVTSVAFSSDGSRVAVGDDSGAVNLFDAGAYLESRAQLRSRICRELDGYEPDPRQWRAAVPSVTFADLCRAN